MDNYTQVIKRIVELRAQQGRTQEELASIIGLSRQRWILVEKGERPLSVGELEKIADFFNVPVASFFTEPRNNEKFEQMYFRILRRIDNNVPKTKLAKLLYLADFRNYYDTLESMSGAQYIRREYGPVADIFFELTENLFDQGKIDIEPYGDALMIRSLSTNTESNLLSNDEKKRIDDICKLWKDKRTHEIVNFTHEQKPWSACKDGEYIPYSLIIQEDPDHVYQPVV